MPFQTNQPKRNLFFFLIGKHMSYSCLVGKSSYLILDCSKVLINKTILFSFKKLLKTLFLLNFFLSYDFGQSLKFLWTEFSKKFTLDQKFF